MFYCMPAKFFSGILPLEIEEGRYSGVLTEECFCKDCNLKVVEDEYNFFGQRPYISDLESPSSDVIS